MTRCDLSRQRNVHDRPRLFAWLASRDFGAQLLHGRRNSSRRDTRVDIQTAAPPQSNHVSAKPPIGEVVSASGASSASVTPNQMLWRAILTTVQGEVPPTEFATWLEDTVLLDVDHTRQLVVVGTPNVFTREAVQQQYIPTLSTGLAAHFQPPYALQVVVDGG